MGTFVAEMAAAGVMLGGDGLQPTVKGKRVKLADGKFTVIDGPFTESKELIASYALFQVKTMEEAVHWTKRFLEVLGKGECELRPIIEAEDFSEEVFTPAERAKEEEAREKMKRNAGGRRVQLAPLYSRKPRLRPRLSGTFTSAGKTPALRAKALRPGTQKWAPDRSCPRRSWML